jgi:hypothetical protein
MRISKDENLHVLTVFYGWPPHGTLATTFDSFLVIASTSWSLSLMQARQGEEAADSRRKKRSATTTFFPGSHSQLHPTA